MFKSVHRSNGRKSWTANSHLLVTVVFSAALLFSFLLPRSDVVGTEALSSQQQRRSERQALELAQAGAVLGTKEQQQQLPAVQQHDAIPDWKPAEEEKQQEEEEQEEVEKDGKQQQQKEEDEEEEEEEEYEEEYGGQADDGHEEEEEVEYGGQAGGNDDAEEEEQEEEEEKQVPPRPASVSATDSKQQQQKQKQQAASNDDDAEGEEEEEEYEEEYEEQADDDEEEAEADYGSSKQAASNVDHKPDAANSSGSSSKGKQQAKAEEEQDNDHGGEEEEEEADAWPEGPSPYQQALAKCTDLKCLTAAAKQQRYPGQRLFPHFFIVGWQKCATTSLFMHLRHHPQLIAAHDKEPEFFSNDCNYNVSACPTDAQKEYIQKTLRLREIVAGDLRQGGAEASTHYGRNGQRLAPQLVQVFPWLKVIASMREPISRAISMLAHNLDLHSAGCLAAREVYSCLSRDLSRQSYSAPFEAWLEAYPRDQLYLVQYENLTSMEHSTTVLQDIKRFLGIDIKQPLDHVHLAHANTRESHLRQKGELKSGEQADGWPIKEEEYRKLVALVRPDAERMAELAQKHGFADGKQWLRNWESEWEATLEGCDEDGQCTVYPN